MTLKPDLPQSALNLFETTGDAVLVLDMTGSIHFANQSFCTLFENKLESIIKKNCEAFQSEPLLNFKEIIRSLALHQTLIQTLTCKKQDGSPISLTASFSFLRDDVVSHTGVLIVFKNKFLETKNEKKFLAQQNQLLRSMNHRQDEICLLYDLINYRNIFCSDTIESILGWTSQEYLTGGWAFSLSITHADDAGKMQAHFQEEINRRNKGSSKFDLVPIKLEYRKRHKNGSYKWMDSESWILNRNHDGDISNILVFLKDISHEKIKSKSKHNSDILSLVQNGIENIILDPGNDSIKKITESQIHLSTREKEILSLVKKGFSTKEISEKLSLKINTINTYRKNLMNKLNAKNSAELVQIAMAQHIS